MCTVCVCLSVCGQAPVIFTSSYGAALASSLLLLLLQLSQRFNMLFACASALIHMAGVGEGKVGKC